MPSITVSDDVLQHIRSLYGAGGETDDQTFARVLAEIEIDRKNRLRAYGASEQNVQFTN